MPKQTSLLKDCVCHHSDPGVNHTALPPSEHCVAGLYFPESVAAGDLCAAFNSLLFYRHFFISQTVNKSELHGAKCERKATNISIPSLPPPIPLGKSFPTKTCNREGVEVTSSSKVHSAGEGDVCDREEQAMF